jgi:hypothetical protein
MNTNNNLDKYGLLDFETASQEEKDNFYHKWAISEVAKRNELRVSLGMSPIYKYYYGFEEFKVEPLKGN